MQLIELIIRAIGIFCLVAAAFCFGYSVVTGKTHVLIMGMLFFCLASLIAYGITKDRKREGDGRKNNGRD